MKVGDRGEGLGGKVEVPPLGGKGNPTTAVLRPLPHRRCPAAAPRGHRCIAAALLPSPCCHCHVVDIPLPPCSPVAAASLPPLCYCCCSAAAATQQLPHGRCHAAVAPLPSALLPPFRHRCFHANAATLVLPPPPVPLLLPRVRSVLLLLPRACPAPLPLPRCQRSASAAPLPPLRCRCLADTCPPAAACPPAHLPACPLACLPACPPAHLPACPPARHPPGPPVHLQTLCVCPPACPPVR